MLNKHHPPDGQDSSVKGPKPETGSAPFSHPKSLRVSFFIDGFNLYHAIDGLSDNRLKWLDLMSLADSYLRPEHKLTAVNYFTSLNTRDKTKRQRHISYINALEYLGVRVILGSFSRARKWCHTIGDNCHQYSEKKTDVAIAVGLLAGAYEDAFDRAFLVTADSDHVPLVEKFQQTFPGKRLFLIAPPKRLTEARELATLVGNRRVFHLTADRIRQHQLPDSLYNQARELVTAKPAHYRAK